MAKKVADAEPAPLPQEPVARKLKSDADDEGLRGKVKIVVDENEGLSAEWSIRGRNPAMTYYYNEQGNLTKKEMYDYRGTPMGVTVYGYLDGDRVEKSNYIRYEYDPPPMAAPSGGGPRPKRDPRYSTKFKYKYDDDGRLAEKGS